jgi:hypothetical protein
MSPIHVSDPSDVHAPLADRTNPAYVAFRNAENAWSVRESRGRWCIPCSLLCMTTLLPTCAHERIHTLPRSSAPGSPQQVGRASLFLGVRTLSSTLTSLTSHHRSSMSMPQMDSESWQPSGHKPRRPPCPDCDLEAQDPVSAGPEEWTQLLC